MDPGSADLAEHLQHALNSRVIIEQAKGVLAERNAVDMTTAFDALRQHARQRNIKLTHLALAVIHATPASAPSQLARPLPDARQGRYRHGRFPRRQQPSAESGEPMTDPDVISAAP